MAKFAVCPACEGEGTVGPGFVYTQDDVDEQFDSRDEFASHIADIRNGMYNEPCDWCKGKRVVPAVTSQGVTAWQDWQAELAYRAEVAQERRFGC